jgi:hypothetical protein
VTDLIITDVKQAKAAYEAGRKVQVDVNAKPLRFIVDSSLSSVRLGNVYDGNWFLVDDDYGNPYASQVVFKQTITSIKDLADFIQSGGGYCHIGSLVIDEAEALKLQKTGDEILRDCNDKTRHVAMVYDSDGSGSYACDYLLGGDWDYIELKDALIEVDFFWSLAHQAECRYDVENLRVTESDLSCVKLDEKYGGGWLMFDRLTATTIAKFAAKAQEEKDNA